MEHNVLNVRIVCLKMYLSTNSINHKSLAIVLIYERKKKGQNMEVSVRQRQNTAFFGAEHVIFLLWFIYVILWYGHTRHAAAIMMWCHVLPTGTERGAQMIVKDRFNCFLTFHNETSGLNNELLICKTVACAAFVWMLSWWSSASVKENGQKWRRD